MEQVINGKFNINIYDRADTIVVTDGNVFKLLNDDVKQFNVFIAPSGESCKDFTSVETLILYLTKCNLTRHGAILAIGGGAVSDLAGFCASIYKRGIKYDTVPTTILSMIDSCVGGKTAVNVNNIKNIVGSFYPARKVYIDMDFIGELSIQEINSSVGELAKYSMICKEIDDTSEYITQLVEGDFTNLNKLINSCISYKQSIVEQDPYDNGVRQILNVGHTIGHGMEVLYNLSHGAAVLNGLYYELKIALELQMCCEKRASKVNEWIEKLDSKVAITNIDALIEKMQCDKKNNKGDIVFVLPYGEEYQTKSVPLNINEVAKLLNKIL